MPTVKPGSSRAWMNCVSNCCRLRQDHQKKASSAGGNDQQQPEHIGLAKS